MTTRPTPTAAARSTIARTSRRRTRRTRRGGCARRPAARAAQGQVGRGRFWTLTPSTIRCRRRQIDALNYPRPGKARTHGGAVLHHHRHPYPNGAPHIGHAYEYIATDAIARFKRLDGFDVFFMTGTDEHGLKMQQTAAEEGIPSADLAARNSDVFEAMAGDAGHLLRPLHPHHRRGPPRGASRRSGSGWTPTGDIYLDTYSGWYSVRDEAFYTEDETTCRPTARAISTETGTPVTWTEEATYFFRLSAYQDKLLAPLRGAARVHRARRPGATRWSASSRAACEDLSISRTTFDWGVPVPGHPDHVMYVWVDALTNYLTGVGFPDTESERSASTGRPTCT